ncbi:hypothetical protein FRACYDRAFT_275497 [Fragilariopsis cylindrus CCMP1102]|uniref:peptidylprolyl isomerase n=1 Tax=Fragilariopsis cylindrus CCMP1102 TaxID=635003 RepID=A0A1E7FFJ8_9STRA|nr:hypothetical protein FRACYDRAFT_275497 [Fragilariopsis cylindrus CCMP1102]|eukprot:OEU16949.1 hypothetical protein FRACYDRAFT_275497 [Fragilariopsis cylindrus CCMP1102]
MTAATNNNEGDSEDDDEQMIDLPDLESGDEKDDDDDENSTASDESSKKKKEDPEVLLLKASAFKEEGNNYFIKEKDFDKASRSYRKGVNAIKNLNKANSGDEQVKTLLLSLNTNLSMMLSKLGKHRQSKDVANKALEIDPFNVKARFRRAVAHRKLGNTEEATMDLKLALQTEPNNVAVRKELASIQKEQKLAKKAQKASLQKAFSKGGLLNDNRVEDEKTKAERLAREKKEADEVLEKRKKEWEDDCVSRMAKGEEAISFEDWDKEQLDKVKAEEEEATRKRKEDEKQKKEERKKTKAAKKAAEKEKGADDGDSDDEFTERELAEMRGYKKTADGGVTSYFTREQSAEEKAMLDIAPKSISDYTPQPITPSSSMGDVGSSAWNHAGTWEEKDTTEWCKNHLEKRLLQSKVEASGSGNSHLSCSITEVKDVTGDASVATVSGKKRYIFDLQCTAIFKIKDSTTDKVIASGSLKLPDLCSTHHDELEVDNGGWKKKPSSDNEQLANDCRLRIVTEVRESIKLWVQDFNSQY